MELQNHGNWFQKGKTGPKMAEADAVAESGSADSRDHERITPFKMPIDVNDLRDYKGGNAEKVRECLRRRFKPVEIVDEIIQLDEKWRKGAFFRMSPFV
jgi:hypothetical protein